MKDRIAAWWFAGAPPARLGLLRLLVGAYSLVHLGTQVPQLLSFASFDPAQFRPVGPAQLISTPLAQSSIVLLLCLLAASGVAFTCGFKQRLIGPLFALLFLWLAAYRSSFGMIFHTENLLTLHLIVLALAPGSADALAVDGRRVDSRPGVDPRYGWPLRLMSTLTVATYFVSGVAKLRNSGVRWLGGHSLRTTIALNTLRKRELGTWSSSLSIWLLRFGWPFRVLAGLSLLLEIGAPLALLDQRIAYGWIACCWSFHAGVLALMAIVFGYPLSGLAYGSFLPLERILVRGKATR